MTELEMLAVAYVFFILLIGVEIAISRARRDGGYRLGEMVVNIGHGVLYQIVDHFTAGLLVLPALLLSSVVTWPLLPMDAWWGWLLGVVLFDLSTYWLHRHHHEIHLLWAIHGTHHAAEDFNFAAALRQPALQRLFGWIWRLPLALIMPAEMIVGVVVFDFLYQFLQHTRYVPTLGPLELILNTPSHHRVHHGREAKYLDRNYGGILIIWDRLFGTFQAEEEEPTYGITRPIGSLNAAWGNLAMFVDLHRAARPLGTRQKLRAWLSGPETLASLRPDLPPPPRGSWSDEDAPRPIRAYVIATAPLAPPLLGWMLLSGGDWGLLVQVFVSLLLVLSVICAGGLLERRPWAVGVEAGRILLAGVGGAILLATPWPLVACALLLAGLALARTAATRGMQPQAAK